MGYFTLIAGIYMMLYTFKVDVTNRTKSIILFKVIPMVLSIGLILIGLNLLNILLINI